MMTREETMAKVQLIFKEVFDDEALVVLDQTTAEDIEDWDSIEQINLILAIEGEFQIKSKMEEIIHLTTVGEMVDFILSKVNRNEK